MKAFAGCRMRVSFRFNQRWSSAPSLAKREQRSIPLRLASLLHVCKIIRSMERLPELSGRKPEEFVDHSLLDELEKEGFFKALGS